MEPHIKLYGVSLAMRDQQCYLIPDTSELGPITPAKQPGTRLTYQGGIKKGKRLKVSTFIYRHLQGNPDQQLEG